MTNINSLATTQQIGWSDLRMVRDAANVLAVRNGTTAQEQRWYNTYTDASNNEYLSARFASNTAQIGTVANGTGTQRQVILFGARVSFGLNANTPLWYVDADNTNSFKATTDNLYDIGASGANRPRNVYVGTNFIVPGGATAVLKSAAAITSGAGASTGTLTNAPAIGNPTCWIPINDNGTTRYVPAW